MTNVVVIVVCFLLCFIVFFSTVKQFISGAISEIEFGEARGDMRKHEILIILFCAPPCMPIVIKNTVVGEGKKERRENKR